jgi:flagellar basal body rod protein FlgC
MIDALSIATGGIAASANRFEKSAQNVVRASVPQTDKQGAEPATMAPRPDLPTAVVETQVSALSFKANVAVFKTADKMIGTLLDTIV